MVIGYAPTEKTFHNEQREEGKLTKILTAREATIKTATVEVRALTISGKQVTQAVFNQLKREDIVDQDTAELRGEPWGIVNYIPSDCSKKGKGHIHVVWQKESELRRACAFSDVDSANGCINRYMRLQALCTYWHDALDLELALADLPLEKRPEKDGTEINLNNRRIWINIRTSEREALEWTPNRAYGNVDWYRKRKDEAISSMRHRIESKTGTTDPLAIYERCGLAEMELAAYEARWNESYSTIAALDQLFIAV